MLNHVQVDSIHVVNILPPIDITGGKTGEDRKSVV